MYELAYPNDLEGLEGRDSHSDAALFSLISMSKRLPLLGVSYSLSQLYTCPIQRTGGIPNFDLMTPHSYQAPEEITRSTDPNVRRYLPNTTTDLLRIEYLVFSKRMTCCLVHDKHSIVAPYHDSAQARKRMGRILAYLGSSS